MKLFNDKQFANAAQALLLAMQSEAVANAAVFEQNAQRFTLELRMHNTEEPALYFFEGGKLSMSAKKAHLQSETFRKHAATLTMSQLVEYVSFCAEMQAHIKIDKATATPYSIVVSDPQSGERAGEVLIGSFRFFPIVKLSEL